jgi:hypothetical protein
VTRIVVVWATVGIMPPKRTEQVNCRLSSADLALLRKAADTLWPGMPITNSTLLLTLARLKAEEILKSPRKRG